MPLSPENYLIAIAKTLQNTQHLEVEYKQRRRYINPPVEIEERGIILVQRPYYFRQTGNLFLPSSPGSALQKCAPITERAWDGKLSWTLRAEEKGTTYERTAISQAVASLGLLEPLRGFFDASQSHLAEVKRAQKQGTLTALRTEKSEKYEGVLCQSITYSLKKQDLSQEQIILTIDPENRVVRTKKRISLGDVTTEEETFLTYKSINKPLHRARFQVVLPIGASAYVPPAPLLSVNTPAPNFTGRTMASEISLTQYRGSVVLLDFWAPWCVPCVKNFPKLQEIAARYKNTNQSKQLIILMIPIWDSSSNIIQWIKKNASDYPDLVFLMGSAETDLIGNKYNISSIPMQYLIDKKNNIAAANPSDSKVAEMIDLLLEAKK
jgi:thiol-disulfide isomerase/thioredoxin